jgi:hypothetical protein
MINHITQRPVHLTGIAAGEEPRLCTLERALEYRNDQILYKFMERWAVSFEEASELFEETKKWLWAQVVARHREHAPPMAMTESIAIIDEMLHSFILFTREYTRYCLDTYGVYLHHAPMTKRQKDARAEAGRKEPDRMLAEEGEFLSKMYTFVYEVLGEATLTRWYGEYPKKYSGQRMVELTRNDRRFEASDVVTRATSSKT